MTHFDISQSMIDKAKELAKEAGVEENITFVKGALEDLSAFVDKSFDLVMSFDAPISYTYPNQETVIGELVRLAKKKIIVSVTSRLGVLPYRANPIQKNQFILNPEDSDGFVQWCITYTFLPEELKGILERFGVRNVELAGPGAFARTVPNEILVKIMNDEKQRREFLEVCHVYDSNPYVCGMGKDNLFAKGNL